VIDASGGRHGAAIVAKAARAGLQGRGRRHPRRGGRDALRAHVAGRVHRKVSAGVAGGTVLGGIPALLASIHALTSLRASSRSSSWPPR
jgi:hypothetical protein